MGKECCIEAETDTFFEPISHYFALLKIKVANCWLRIDLIDIFANYLTTYKTTDLLFYEKISIFKDYASFAGVVVALRAKGKG